MGKSTFNIKTKHRSQMVEITDEVQELITAQKVKSGAVLVYCPHTTAGLTINENADPDVVHDTLRQLDEMVPWEQTFYKHGEGNSAAHVKASMMGSSVTLMIEEGRLQLGTWQGVWLSEFDGPRTRQVWVKVTAD